MFSDNFTMFLKNWYSIVGSDGAGFCVTVAGTVVCTVYTLVFLLLLLPNEQWNDNKTTVYLVTEKHGRRTPHEYVRANRFEWKIA